MKETFNRPNSYEELFGKAVSLLNTVLYTLERVSEKDLDTIDKRNIADNSVLHLARQLRHMGEAFSEGDFYFANTEDIRFIEESIKRAIVIIDGIGG